MFYMTSQVGSARDLLFLHHRISSCGRLDVFSQYWIFFFFRKTKRNIDTKKKKRITNDTQSNMIEHRREIWHPEHVAHAQHERAYSAQIDFPLPALHAVIARVEALSEPV